MFDPRMMSPDGSSYSRQNALAGIQPLAATSGPATPPGVQTMAPQPNALAGMHGPRDWRHMGGMGGPGFNGPGRMTPEMMPLFQQQFQDWRTGFQDWRGDRPQPVPGQPRPDDWKTQMYDWRQARPDRFMFTPPTGV